MLEIRIVKREMTQSLTQTNIEIPEIIPLGSYL